MLVKSGILILACLCSVVQARAQTVQISGIEITGNDRTKELTILRELDFAPGDTISQAQLSLRLERSRTNLLNTALFTAVEMNVSEWDTDQHKITVSVTVKEAWYLYILPIFDLADRNINVWITEHNAAFNRTNIGLRVIHINLTGVRDRLKAKAQLGYTRKLQFDYKLPYFNKQKSLGLLVKTGWSANREIVYRIQDNKEQFYRDPQDKDVFGNVLVQAGLQYRPNLYFSQELELSYQFNKVAQQIAEDDNPDFFLDGRTRQEFISLKYKAIYDTRNLRLFSTKGLLLSAEVLKEGVGIFGDLNNLSILPHVEYDFPVAKRISVGLVGEFKYSLIRDQQPFWNYRGLGYQQSFVRGYELYVINGLDYVLGKVNTKVLVAQTQINWKKKLPKAFREMSLQLFGTLNYDIGYVKDPFYSEGNPLVNRTLSGGGPGLSLILYYNFAISLEYNFNNRGENGLFLQTKTSF